MTTLTLPSFFKILTAWMQWSKMSTSVKWRNVSSSKRCKTQTTMKDSWSSKYPSGWTNALILTLQSYVVPNTLLLRSKMKSTMEPGFRTKNFSKWPIFLVPSTSMSSNTKDMSLQTLIHLRCLMNSKTWGISKIVTMHPFKLTCKTDGVTSWLAKSRTDLAEVGQIKAALISTRKTGRNMKKEGLRRLFWDSNWSWTTTWETL